MKTTLKKFFLLNTAAMMLHISASAQVVTTLTKSFGGPSAIIVGKADTLYVADQIDNVIKKIDPFGNVSAFVGSGIYGNADGIGAAAEFGYVYSMLLDRLGNIIALDFNNGSIRKITPAGAVTTIATGLRLPNSMLWGKDDTLIVYNRKDSTIVKVAPTGAIIPFFSSTVNGGDLAKGNNDTLYLSGGYSNHQIYKIDPNGTMTTLAGSGVIGSADGISTAATFNRPLDIEVDGGGNLYVTDAKNQKIRKVTPSGVVTTFAGSGSSLSTDGTGTAASFYYPSTITMVAATGIFYIGDYGSGAIRKMTGGVPLPLKLNKPAFAASELKVFPSPFTEVFTISSSKAQSAQLINNLGQVILQIDIVAGEQQVSMVGQPSGIYYLKNENGSVQRIVKL